MIRQFSWFLILFLVSFSSIGQRKSVTYFIYFNSYEENLNQIETIRLEKLCDSLSTLKIKSISITGHTDNTNDEESNMILSEKRAKSIREFLIGKKFNESIISISAMGESNPIESNATEKGKAMNRRVELKLVFE